MNSIQDRLRKASASTGMEPSPDLMVRVEQNERIRALLEDAADRIDMLEEELSDYKEDYR